MITIHESTLRYGFILEEEHIRRFIRSIEEQFTKLNQTPHWTFSIIQKNNTINKTTNIDGVLFESNLGSSQISQLTLYCKGDDKDTEVEVIFDDLSSNDSAKPISLRVLGSDKDWIYVTHSIIKERLSILKRFSTAQIYQNFFGVFFTVLIMGLLTVALMTTFIGPKTDFNLHKILEEAKIKGELNDSVDVMIMVEKKKQEYQKDFNKKKYPAVIKTIIIMTIIISLQILFTTIYPQYIFCWGEYKEIYNKRRKYFGAGSVE